MKGEFTLKTSKGDVALRLTKRVFYNIEKARGQSFIAPFAIVGPDGTVTLNPLEVANSSLQVLLAVMAQANAKKMTAEQLVDCADPKSLTEFMGFAIEEFLEQRGFTTENTESEETKNA